MRVSCGVPTPTGTYYTPARYRWLKMVGDTWAQWCTQIQGNYLFHSVPNWTRNNLDLEVGEYNQLGNTRSLGCIRLNCEDAKWIYDNCGLGTQVNISATMTSGPLEKPEGLQIPIWHTWDPTDPTAHIHVRPARLPSVAEVKSFTVRFVREAENRFPGFFFAKQKRRGEKPLPHGVSVSADPSVLTVFSPFGK